MKRGSHASPGLIFAGPLSTFEPEFWNVGFFLREENQSTLRKTLGTGITTNNKLNL